MSMCPLPSSGDAARRNPSAASDDAAAVVVARRMLKQERHLDSFPAGGAVAESASTRGDICELPHKLRHALQEEHVTTFRQRHQLSNTAAVEETCDYPVSDYLHDVCAFSTGEVEGATDAIRSTARGLVRTAAHPLAALSAPARWLGQAVGQGFTRTYDDTRTAITGTLAQALSSARNGGRFAGNALASAAATAIPYSAQGRAAAAAAGAALARGLSFAASHAPTVAPVIRAISQLRLRPTWRQLGKARPRSVPKVADIESAACRKYLLRAGQPARVEPHWTLRDARELIARSHARAHVSPDGVDPKAYAMLRGPGYKPGSRGKESTTVWRSARQAEQDLREILRKRAADIEGLRPGEKLATTETISARTGYNSCLGGTSRPVTFNRASIVIEKLPDGSIKLNHFSPRPFHP